MRRLFLFMLMLVVMTGCQRTSQPSAILPSGKIVSLEIAKTALEKEVGLMNRTSFSSDSGMLFIFEEPRILSFWMKNTLIPLDIIFLDQEKKITNIETMMPCPKEETMCPITLSSKEATYALEINAGKAQEWTLQAGDTLSFQIPDDEPAS